jgi:uncharacterized protein (DUF983 family)
LNTNRDDAASMKRTLLAVGVIVLASMMFMPVQWDSDRTLLPFFFLVACPCRVLWTPFALQTVFAAIAAAVIVNLLPYRRR